MTDSSGFVLHDTYIDECQRARCKPNTELLRIFSTVHTDSLTSIDLSKNMLGPHGIVPFLKAVSVHAKELLSLVMPHNTLGNEAVTVLCDTFASHRSIRDLDLSHNPISHAGGKRLLQFVASGPRSLRTLALNDTLINIALIAKIQAALASSYTSRAGAILDSTAVTQDEADPATPSSPPNSPAGWTSTHAAAVTTGGLADSGSRKKSVAMVSPPNQFLALSALHLALRETDKSSPTSFTTSQNQALAILHLASRSFTSTPQDGSSYDKHHSLPTLTPRRPIPLPPATAAAGSSLTGSSPRSTGQSGSTSPSGGGAIAIGGSKSHSQEKAYVMVFFNVLSVMLDVPSHQFTALQLLLKATTRAVTKKVDQRLPTLQLLRGGDVERRDGSRIAVNILLTAAFADPLPQFSEVVKHSAEADDDFSKVKRRQSLSSSVAQTPKDDPVAFSPSDSIMGQSNRAGAGVLVVSGGTSTTDHPKPVTTLASFIPVVPFAALKVIFDAAQLDDPKNAGKFDALIRLEVVCNQRIRNAEVVAAA